MPDASDDDIQLALILALLHQAGGTLRIPAQSWHWACDQLTEVGFEHIGEGEALLLRLVDADAQPFTPHEPDR
jgi:hypothetical protein